MTTPVFGLMLNIAKDGSTASTADVHAFATELVLLERNPSTLRAGSRHRAQSPEGVRSLRFEVTDHRLRYDPLLVSDQLAEDAGRLPVSAEGRRSTFHRTAEPAHISARSA